MKLFQMLEQCFARWTESCGLGFCLLDQNDEVLLRTGECPLPEADLLADFRGDSSPCIKDNGFSLFHVADGDENAYVLVVSGPDKKAAEIGPLSVCQAESLIAASGAKSDRREFFQEMLLGHMSDGELEKQARRHHVSVSAPRVVMIIETQKPQDSGIHSVIRTVMGSRTRDHFISIEENMTVVLRELDGRKKGQDTDETAYMLVGALNTEAMVKARVSYSNPFDHLGGCPLAYRQALAAMEIGKIFNAELSVTGYAHLGIGRLIYQLPKDICETFVNDILQAESLESLDEETLHIIRTFFDNNLNLSETARQLYVHRNTLVYRFEKLQKKYGLDLRTFEDALSFKLAMLVSDYLAYTTRHGL